MNQENLNGQGELTHASTSILNNGHVLDEIIKGTTSNSKTRTGPPADFAPLGEQVAKPNLPIGDGSNIEPHLSNTVGSSQLSLSVLEQAHNEVERARFHPPQGELGVELISPSLHVPHPSKIFRMCCRLELTKPAAIKNFGHVEGTYNELCETAIEHEGLRQRQFLELQSDNLNNKKRREEKEIEIEKKIDAEKTAQEKADDATVARDKAGAGYSQKCDELGLHPTSVSEEALKAAVERLLEIERGRRDWLVMRVRELSEQLGQSSLPEKLLEQQTPVLSLEKLLEQQTPVLSLENGGSHESE